MKLKIKKHLSTNKKTRFFTLLLVAALVVPQIIQGIRAAYAMATTRQIGEGAYSASFYDQLTTDNERKFYNAIDDLIDEEAFANGTAETSGKKGADILEVKDIQLPSALPGEDDQEGLQKFGSELLRDMGAGRDAFMLDHPDLFYIDFDAIVLTIHTDENGNDLKVYVGAGRKDQDKTEDLDAADRSTYINQEFVEKIADSITIKYEEIKNAIATVNGHISRIATDARDHYAPVVKDMIKYAHDEVIKAAKYELEHQSKHPYSVRTVYGVFGINDEPGRTGGAGSAVCEGYARALKAILDKLNIPAVLVYGNYMDKGKPQEHMWLNVKVDDKWYGIDPTFDNDAND